MADVVLKVNGQQFDGWESVRVTRGIEAIAGGFELSVTDRWADQNTSWPIAEEDECSLLVNGVTLITGWVDKRSLRFGPSEHSITINGRDRAGALVDCSAALKNWEFASTPLLSLVSKLCAPFRINVTMDPNVTAKALNLKIGKSQGSVSGAGKAGKHSGMGIPQPPKKFSVDPGESTFEVIDRACRMAGVLPVSDGLGNLVLTRAGSGRATSALVQGQNVLGGSADFDASTRYHKYIVAAQRQATDEDFGEGVAGVTGVAFDSDVKRTNRVLVVRPESGSTAYGAKVRAGWEAKVRAARADSVSVSVQGWTQDDSTLWPINALVNSKLPDAGINGDMLITQTVFNLDDSGGLTTQITLRRPDAYLPEPSASGSGLWKELAGGV